MIPSKDQINQKIFESKLICPVFITDNESYILVKGENLWDFYRSKRSQ